MGLGLVSHGILPVSSGNSCYSDSAAIGADGDRYRAQASDVACNAVM
jgi:hypothetical protein